LNCLENLEDALSLRFGIRRLEELFQLTGLIAVGRRDREVLACLADAINWRVFTSHCAPQQVCPRKSTRITFLFHAETRRTSREVMYFVHDSVFEADHVEVDQQAHAVISELQL
jgi:hypothetical protein